MKRRCYLLWDYGAEPFSATDHSWRTKIQYSTQPSFTTFISLHTLFPKETQLWSSHFSWFPGISDPDPRSCRFCQMMTFGPMFNDLHSSPKETQLRKSCVSFGEECMLLCIGKDPLCRCSVYNPWYTLPNETLNETLQSPKLVTSEKEV